MQPLYCEPVDEYLMSWKESLEIWSVKGEVITQYDAIGFKI